MNGLIRASLRNPYAVTVAVLTIVILGVLSARSIPDRHSAGLQQPGRAGADVLQRHAGREHREGHHQSAWSAGPARPPACAGRNRARSSAPASSATTYRSDIDPNGALTQVNRWPRRRFPTCRPARCRRSCCRSIRPARSRSAWWPWTARPRPNRCSTTSGRYEVRNIIMAIPGAIAPVVYGGKIRAVHGLPRPRQAAGSQPVAAGRDERARQIQLVPAHRRRQVRRHRLRHRFQLDVRAGRAHGGHSACKTEHGNAIYPARRGDAERRAASSRPTSCASTAGAQVYIPVFRQLGASTLDVVDDLQGRARAWRRGLPRPDIDLKMVMDQSVYVRQSIESLVAGGRAGGGALLAGDSAFSWANGG